MAITNSTHSKTSTVRRWLAAAAVAFLTLVAMPTAAHADSDDDVITRYQVHAAVQQDGSVEVTIDFDFDFGDDEGHGPYLTLPERMRLEGDPDHWRSLPISDITASSPTAPADVEIERDDGAVLVRIGDEDVEIEGSHSYQVSYRMAGAVNPEAAGSGLDEFSWNAVGTEWEIPLRNVSVTVDTPAEIEQVACFTGKSYLDPCATEPSSSGTSAEFTAGDLEPGAGLQVVAGMPAGSFPDVVPIITERYHPARVLGTTPESMISAGAVLAAGVAAAVLLVRRGGHRQFAGVAPGEIPDTGPLGRAKQVRATGEVPMRSQPPQAVSPGLVGVLDDMVADQDDVTAVLIDLAVRGHLRIEEYPNTDEEAAAGYEAATSEPMPDPKKLIRTTPPPGALLRTHEQVLLDTLFADGDVVDLAEDGALIAATSACQKAIYEEATTELGWFNGNPSSVRKRWGFTGAALLVVGVLATIFLGVFLRLGFIGIAIGAVGLLVCILSGRAPGRSALGTAIWTQAQGFKKYLEQVEADQITVEPGVDLWSRYLPWAMIWGATAQWTSVFATLSARGEPIPTPVWYLGLTPWVWTDNGSSILSGVDALSTSATSAMTSMSASSGGGTGFSGGGGVGGGGGGGW